MSGAHQCLLYKVERCPLHGGSKCISSMVKSFGGKSSVCCREVVPDHFSPLEGGVWGSGQLKT